MFHQINDKKDPFYPALPINTFELLCKFLSKNFNVIHFSDINNHFNKKANLPSAIITFDDGHYDVLENAYPILKKYDLKFNINIVTESITTGLPNNNVKIYDVLNSTDKKEYINTNTVLLTQPIRIPINKKHPEITELKFRNIFHQVTAQKRDLLTKDITNQLSTSSTKFSKMLSKEDVIFLKKNGGEVGSHTCSHSILSDIEDSQVEFELKHSKKILEELCSNKIDIIAFPQGKHKKTTIQKSFEAGYKYILLTNDNKNFEINFKNGIYERIGLYHKSFDENLAKIFGFHSSVNNLKVKVKKCLSNMSTR
ncbi:MAG: polysaccharide deacetylase family protein [Oligoflexia bacterium]|nr:polysaccharide deacetylase family protein [Oligoflexia bacterium]